MKKKLLMLLFLFSGIGISGCEEDNLAPQNKTYQQFILGKWELIAQGTSYDISDAIIHPAERIYPVEPNLLWLEFLSDWKMHIINALGLKNHEEKKIYRIDSEFLYQYDDDGSGRYGNEANTHVFTYSFNEKKDELTLQHVKGNIEAIYPVIDIHVYKRIK